MSKDSTEALQRTRLAEEAAAREILLHRSTEKKPKLPGPDREPTLVSNVQDLTRLVPTLSARDLLRLADSIKRRRLQVKKLSSPRPDERLRARQDNTQVKQAELSVETTATTDSFPLEEDSTSKELNTTAMEERLLQRLLDTRNRRAPQLKQAKEVEKSVPHLADGLEPRATRHNDRILLELLGCPF